MSLKIVPLSNKNISFVADMHLEAFRGHLNVLLGKDYIKTFLKWFYQSNIAIHHVIENNEGKVLGYVIGAKWGYQKDLNKYLLTPGIVAILKHPWVVFNPLILNTIYLRLLILLGRNSHIENTASKYFMPLVSLVGIAVSKEARGQNIGKILIDTFENSAKEKGYLSMRLSVYRTNKRAREFYKKHGWLEEASHSTSHVTAYYKSIV